MSTIAERRARIEAVHPLTWTTNMGADRPEFHAVKSDTVDTSHIDMSAGFQMRCGLPDNVLLAPLHAKHAARIGTLCSTCYPEDAS